MKIITINNTPKATLITETIKVLDSGGLVLFPTETTYGAGVDATNQTAVNKLLTYKSRREGKPLSIFVANQEMAEKYVNLTPQAQSLYSQFLPGPVTVVSESKGIVAEGVASEFGTLGIRIPDYQLLLDLSLQYQKPITATSANASGKKRPYSIEDILSGLSAKQKSLIDLVLDAGTLPKNDPSTVIDTTLETPITLRESQHIKTENADSGTTLESSSEDETQNIAGKLLLKNWNKINAKGIVLGLDGQLGMGKTIFAKGSAKFLKIEDKITSPTYSYIEEYTFKRHQTEGKLYHLDMWKVDSQVQFDRLQIPKLLQPNNVVVIEWFTQVREFLLPILQDSKIPLVQVLFKPGSSESKRKLTIYES